MPEAIVIPVRSWQDPQGDVILVYSESECSVFFACWTPTREPADYIGCLSFEHARAVRSFGREFCPYTVPRNSAHSYIMRIPTSDLLSDHAIYRRHAYPDSPSPEPLHFVVLGHDIYHEILATSFSERTMLRAELTEERLVSLHGNA